MIVLFDYSSSTKNKDQIHSVGGKFGLKFCSSGLNKWELLV